MLDRNKILFSLAAGVLAASSTRPAHAGYVSGFTTSSIAIPNNHVVDQQGFNNTTNASLLVPTTISSSVSYGSTQSNGFATGSLGDFHAYAHSYNPYDPNSTAYDSQTHDQVNALDYFVVKGLMGQANGTPVQVMFTLALSGSVVDGFVPYENYESVTVANLNGGDGTSSYSLTYNSQSAGPPNIQTAILDTTVGSTVSIQASLDSTTYVGNNSPATLAIQDFSNTMHYYADSITPGIQLVSSSGYNYSSPSAVPEPSSILLLGVGTVIAVARVARGRRPPRGGLPQSRPR